MACQKSFGFVPESNLLNRLNLLGICLGNTQPAPHYSNISQIFFALILCAVYSRILRRDLTRGFELNENDYLL